VSNSLVTVTTSLELDGLQSQTTDLLTSTCEKACEIIRLCLATQPEQQDTSFGEDDILTAFPSQENLLTITPSSQRSTEANNSPRSGEADVEETDSSLKSGEEQDVESGSQIEGGGKRASNAGESENHLHPAHWFYATPDPATALQAPINVGGQNIWKENWGGLVFVEENGKMQIESASLNQLLIRLTSTSPDALAASDFYRTFMMTMQTFTEPELFVKKLIERYEVPPSPQQGDLDKKRYEMHLKTPVQMRVCNLL